ncbi:armadillo-type protein [Mycena olivaceomarginata]|nr:armadillo-type protein [Mycena olivaceomarginata]
MPPLTRQESRPSIHSWWSDSNPGLQGPTINLHAAAKPLMRLMYYRQALDILRKNRGSPLTTAILDTYASYFPWDYVSWATKAAILSELADRTESSEVEARAVVESPVFPHIAQMLGSPHPQARICSCRLLGNLAGFTSTAPAVLELKLCEQLVFLLDDNNSGVIRVATKTLSQITQWVDGAKGVVDAKVLDHVLRLLKSPNLKTRESASILVGDLASHESTAPAVLKLNPSVQLVSLLGGEDSLVRWVTYTLSRIAQWVDGAKGVVDAKVLDHILRLLESPNPDTQKWASNLVGNLTSHKSTAPAVLKLNPSVQLVSLLGGEDSLVRWVTYALSRIAQWVDGAKGVVDAKALDHVLRLLKSPNLDTQKSASKLVGNLASHKSTAPAVLKLNPSVQLVSLLGGGDSLITRWVDGVKGVVDAKVLDHVLRLLESPNPDTQKWASNLVGNLASHKSTAPAVLKLNPSVQLVSLLGQDSLVHWVTFALSRIAEWVDGAKGVVDAKVLDHVLRLLESPNPDTQKWASNLVGNLTSHKSTAPAVLRLNPSVQLVSLLGGEDSLVRWVTYALSQIAQWADGAKGVVDAKALDHVLRLLKSPNLDTQKSASKLVGNLASHKSTAPAVLKLNPSVQLVSLLGGEDSLVRWVMCALSRIAQWVDGAKGVVDANVLYHILRLLESPNTDIRRWVCELAGHLASHKSTAPALLQLNICTRLVSLQLDIFARLASLLGWISRWADGAKAVVDTKVFDHILPLLKSPNPATRRWACELAGNLANYKPIAPAILKLNISAQLVLNISAQLVSILGDEDYVVRWAIYALSQIAQWVDGAKGVVDSKVLDHILKLLKSPNPYTRGWACVLVKGLASHEATAPAILQLKPIPQLKSLLWDPNPLIYDSAFSALVAIWQWPDVVDVAAPTDSDGALRA